MKDVSHFDVLEARFHTWLAQNSIPVTRFAVGVIFFWFGVLKFFPGLSPAQDLAGRTISTLTLGHITPHVSLPILATWECLIGIGLLTASGQYMRVTLVLLALQLPGTFLPLVFFPAETWTHFPYAPTLEGQYIMKNLVLISAGLLMGATMHGGKVIMDPKAANLAEKKQEAYSRYRRRFRIEP
jgi:uncharacterized membrane protein YkgB